MGLWRKGTGWRSRWVVLAAVLCVLQAVPGGFGPGSPGRPAPAAASDGETRPATSRTTYSCPSPPSGYQYSRRRGRTCYYTKTQTISGAATSRTTYSCPSTYRGYRYSHLSGSTCHYTRTATTTADTTSETTYSCSSTHRGGYRLSRRVGRTCFYARTDTTTSFARSSTTYSCASTYRGYQLSRRVGRICHYSRTYTITRSADFNWALRRFTCPSTYRGYRYSRLIERKCHYTKTATTTDDATRETTYSCSSTYRGYRYSRRSGRVCYYSKTSTTTADATSETTYSCSSTYRGGYRLSRRIGRTCHYSRTISTTTNATSETTYSCPSAHRIYISYLYSHRDESLCYYSRTINQTRPAIVRTTYSCPSAPANHRFSRRRGSTCYYTPVTTTTTTTTSTTTTTTTTPSTTTTSTPTTTTTQATATTQAATDTTTTTTQPTTTTAPSGTPSGSSTRSVRLLLSMPVPDGLEANSNSPQQTEGQAVFKWNAVNGTRRHYEVQYREVRATTRLSTVSLIPVPAYELSDDPESKVGKWKNVFITDNPISRRSVGGKITKTISGLYLNVYYEIRVRTVNSTGSNVSSWAKSIYTYPTYEPVPKHDSSLLPIAHHDNVKAIGIVRVTGFLDANSGNAVHPGSNMSVYSYVICSDTLPQQSSTRNRIITEIENGIDAWSDSTGGMVQGVHHTSNGIPKNCNTLASGLLRNKIKLLSDVDLKNKCQFTLLADAIDAACVFWVPSGWLITEASGKITATDIFIYNNASTGNNGKQCSKMHRIAMHEVAHAFGFYDKALIKEKSIMNTDNDDMCNPTVHDIASMKAIYQSRSSTSSSSTSNTEPHATTTTTNATTTTIPDTSTATIATATSSTTTNVASSSSTITTTATSTTVTTSTTTTTSSSNRPVTVWQIETLPSSHQPHHTITTFVFTSGNTFTYSGRTYTIKEIKVYNRGTRIKATPDLKDHELPGGTLLRFWPTDTPSNVQTLRLSDATEQVAGHQWDIIWQRNQYPVNVHRNTTWHIDLTIPATQ